MNNHYIVEFFAFAFSTIGTSFTVLRWYHSYKDLKLCVRQRISGIQLRLTETLAVQASLCLVAYVMLWGYLLLRILFGAQHAIHFLLVMSMLGALAGIHWHFRRRHTLQQSLRQIQVFTNNT